jgi:hypothetical protein
VAYRLRKRHQPICRSYFAHSCRHFLHLPVWYEPGRVIRFFCHVGLPLHWRRRTCWSRAPTRGFWHGVDPAALYLASGPHPVETRPVDIDISYPLTDYGTGNSHADNTPDPIASILFAYLLYSAHTLKSEYRCQRPRRDASLWLWQASHVTVFLFSSPGLFPRSGLFHSST